MQVSILISRPTAHCAASLAWASSATGEQGWSEVPGVVSEGSSWQGLPHGWSDKLPLAVVWTNCTQPADDSARENFQGPGSH